MPSLVQQLSAHRQLTALRAVVRCKAKSTVLREGPAAGDGPGAAWVAFLCPTHSEGLPEWPATQTHADQDSMPCGSVLDFRPPEQLLQSHADLWLTPLTGVRADTYGGVWYDVLEQAERVVRERLEQEGDADEDGPLQSIVTMMWFACRAANEGDLMQAAVSLGYCETLAQSLEARPEDGLAPQ
ncbi:hypothetical protein [Streptomyces hokutonensis]|uniref:hypothetical protein n=1 Tax=Streptomyces hokutonensis TaxID=1306990 RepID=UPI00036C171F|nr:hypothetical protein [Streptomyces hokutonensis]